MLDVVEDLQEANNIDVTMRQVISMPIIPFFMCPPLFNTGITLTLDETRYSNSKWIFT